MGMLSVDEIVEVAALRAACNCHIPNPLVLAAPLDENNDPSVPVLHMIVQTDEHGNVDFQIS